ncbi:MAG: pyruvate kinase [Bacilli bacterium]|nr:pyruvate kinase [Bacilli bacterium]
MSIKRTKIICSIGPATETEEILTKLAKEGMNVVRLNFSHGNYEEYKARKELVEKVRKNTGYHIGLLYDTKGPDFRTLEMENNGVELIDGKTIRIVKEDVVGNSERISVNYKNVLDKLQKGDTVLFDDGLMMVKVISKEKDGVTCEIINGGVLSSRKGVATPGVSLDIPFLSEQDKKDIKFACENDGDFLALSFVTCKKDIEDVRKLLEKYNRTDMKIISKVESKTAIDNLDEIISASDGIMVARGDLGVELPMQELPILQKLMIQKCREQGKFCIVATEMLASMYTSSRPTRAEVSDISNAVLDGCDAVMLSGETTIGKHPVEAVRYMSDICKEAEEFYDYGYEYDYNHDKAITAAVAKAVVASIEELDAKAIVVPTMGGHSARVMSNLKPEPIIIATCPNEKVARSLSLNFGVYCTVVPIIDEFGEIIKVAREESTRILKLKKKDVIVITGGIHSESEVNQTNFLKIEEI